jgi:penicillin-binding protein 2
VDSQAVREQLHKESPTGFPNTSWSEGDNIEMAFGQGGTVVTPIEEAEAYATFANGGTRYQPQIAAAIVNPVTDKVVKRFAPKVTGHVDLPPSIYTPILQGLEGVVSNVAGTAYGSFQQYADFSESQFQVAGKTGTGDVTNDTITRGDQEPDSWFVGFGPNPNPQYVVVVVVDHGGYGAQAAAPAVASIFNYLVANPIAPLQLPTPRNQPKSKPLHSNTPPPPKNATTTTTTSPPRSTTTTEAPTTTTTTSPPATTTTTPQPG